LKQLIILKLIYGLEARLLDVETAFQHGDLDVDIVGNFEPTMYGFRKGKTAGITPDDLR